MSCNIYIYIIYPIHTLLKRNVDPNQTWRSGNWIYFLKRYFCPVSGGSFRWSNKRFIDSLTPLTLCEVPLARGRGPKAGILRRRAPRRPRRNLGRVQHGFWCFLCCGDGMFRSVVWVSYPGNPCDKGFLLWDIPRRVKHKLQPSTLTSNWALFRPVLPIFKSKSFRIPASRVCPEKCRRRGEWEVLVIEFQTYGLWRIVLTASITQELLLCSQTFRMSSLWIGWFELKGGKLHIHGHIPWQGGKDLHFWVLYMPNVQTL